MIRAVASRSTVRGLLVAPRAARAMPILRSPAVSRFMHNSVLHFEQAKMPVGEVEPRLQLTFTCTVPDCGTRSTHEFSKRSYTNGVVLVECPGCKNRHLIADNLGWFTEHANEPRTIEEIVRAKNGKVRVGTAYADGQGGQTIEIREGDDTTSS